jgi:hypothetical protein
MTNEPNDKEITAFQVSIDNGYYDLEPDEKREFLRSLLGTMSPNQEVRDRSKTQSKKFRDKFKK